MTKPYYWQREVERTNPAHARPMRTYEETADPYTAYVEHCHLMPDVVVHRKVRPGREVGVWYRRQQ